MVLECKDLNLLPTWCKGERAVAKRGGINKIQIKPRCYFQAKLNFTLLIIFYFIYLFS